MKRIFKVRQHRARFSPLPAIASILIAVVALAVVEHGSVVPSESAGASDRLLIGDFGASAGTSIADLLRAAGARPAHVYPPDAAIAWLPDDVLPLIASRWPGVAIYDEGESPDASVVLSATQLRAVAYWNARAAHEADAAGKDLGNALSATDAPSPEQIDLFIRPENTGGSAGKGTGELAANSAPYGAQFWDTSEFMLGDVAISVVMVESNGAIDANAENWTQPQRDLIAAEVPNALNWWIGKAGARPLTFTYTFRDASTGYEPITRTQPQEGLWTAEALASFGYSSGDYFTRAATFNNAMRDSLGTDWAVTVFIVNSLVDADGKFADNFFAYAYLGGPFLIMTYDNNGWGIGNMDAVLAHELGHSFYALDEYAFANQPCSKISGYLAASNGNSALTGCPMNEPNSIMRSVPLSVAVVDSFTMGQIGWWDGDVDGLPNTIDTAPVATIASYDPLGGDPYRLTVTGSATDVPLANQNPYGWGHDISLNEISGVEWRVDGGAWTAAAAVDGDWDTADEDFTFDTGTLSIGSHVVEVRATNSESNVQAAPDSVTVSINAVTSVEPGGNEVGLPASSAIASLGVARPNPARPETEILWSLAAPAEMSLSILDVSGRRVRLVASGRYSPGAFSSVWDGRDDDGSPVASGHYFYQLEAGDFRETRKLTVVR
ncbi:MAG: FlgD immunoglobulin-like domain containing protein [bacterium]